MVSFDSYQAPAFLDLISRLYRLRPISLFNEPDLNDLSSFFIPRRSIRRGQVFALPFGFHLSPPFRNQNQETRFFAGLAEYSKRTGNNVILNSPTDCHRTNRIRVADNPVLELDTDYDRIRAGYSRNLRSSLNRNANKAGRHGIRIAVSSDRRELRRFWVEVFTSQYIDRHRMVFHPCELFAGLLDAGLATFLLARMDDRPVGGMILIQDRGTLHYNWGANLSPHNIAIGTLLVDAAIRLALERGERVFDFGSTPLSDLELLHFKLRWGATPIPVYRYYTLSPGRIVDLNSSFGAARALYSRLPKPLLRWLVPGLLPWIAR